MISRSLGRRPSPSPSKGKSPHRIMMLTQTQPPQWVLIMIPPTGDNSNSNEIVIVPSLRQDDSTNLHFPQSRAYGTQERTDRQSGGKIKDSISGWI